jgi:sensor c-di-GMP phosphodiesterase-like protein
MTSSRKKRIFVAAAAALLGVALGALGGYLLARAIMLRLTMRELDQYAWRIMQQGERSSGDSEQVLQTLQAGHSLACSDAEIASFRTLIFNSEYLKDAGRLSGGQVYCSAVLGRLERPRGDFKPAFALLDGTQVYSDLNLMVEDTGKRVGVERGGFFVIFGRHMPELLGKIPLNFTVTEIDETGRQPGWLTGGMTQAQYQILTRDNWAQAGDSLYATHCSPHYHNCFTAYISRDRVFQDARGVLNESALLGVLAGVLAGVLIFLRFGQSQGLAYRLRRAIRRDELWMVYQPIVELSSGLVVEAEALVRWTDEDGFAISPEVFVHLAEERGFVGELTELVLRHALRDFGPTLQRHPGFRLNINVTASDLADAKFLPLLERSLATAGVRARSLAIELTEGSTAQKQLAMEVIRQLRARGHSVQIDDFGTGYSSLAYLKDLDVDAIKIDRSFTQSIGTGAVTVAILPQILAMAAGLDLKVIVEGIETVEQAAYFAGSGKQIMGQGWLFGRPVPAEELQDRLVNEASALEPLVAEV